MNSDPEPSSDDWRKTINDFRTVLNEFHQPKIPLLGLNDELPCLNTYKKLCPEWYDQLYKAAHLEMKHRIELEKSEKDFVYRSIFISATIVLPSIIIVCCILLYLKVI